MRKGSHSEAFLSLFTTPDRAASIVGDLLEESQAQQRAWYALKLVGIAFSLALRSARLAPMRCLKLVALGAAVYACVWSIFFVAIALPWYAWYRITEPGFWIRIALVVIFANLFTGFILGRWVSIRGTNALVPLTVLWFVAWPTELALAKLVYLAMPLDLLVLAALAYPLFGLLPLLVGGTVAQHMRPRVAPSAQ